MKKRSRRKVNRGNCAMFPPRAQDLLSLSDIRAAVEAEIRLRPANPVLCILYNEFQALLGDNAFVWRSRRYRVKDLWF